VGERTVAPPGGGESVREYCFAWSDPSVLCGA
jgi:hypothetical protein